MERSNSFRNSSALFRVVTVYHRHSITVDTSSMGRPLFVQTAAIWTDVPHDTSGIARLCSRTKPQTPAPQTPVPISALATMCPRAMMRSTA